MSEPRTGTGRGFVAAVSKAVLDPDVARMLGDDGVPQLVALVSVNAITDAILDIEREAADSAARVAEVHAERLKHTTHRDGLGMGWQAGEELCREIAARIRALGEEQP